MSIHDDRAKVLASAALKAMPNDPEVRAFAAVVTGLAIMDLADAVRGLTSTVHRGLGIRDDKL